MTRTHQVRRRRGAPIAHDPDAVRAAREEAGLKQYELAAALGISYQLMNDIEHGRRNASFALQRDIAGLTNVAPDRLAARRTGSLTRPHV